VTRPMQLSSATHYLFVDLDGVLQTPDLGEYVELENLPVLDEWLRTRPHVKIVLMGLELETAIAHWQPRMGAVAGRQLVATLPSTAQDRARGGRERYIREWLINNGGPACRWAVLDDETLLYSETCSRLVHVHKWTGLLPEHLTSVDDVLSSDTPAPREHADSLRHELRPLSSLSSPHGERPPGTGKPELSPAPQSRPWWKRLLGK
jgi:hypothetical protein